MIRKAEPKFYKKNYKHKTTNNNCRDCSEWPKSLNYIIFAGLTLSSSVTTTSTVPWSIVWGSVSCRQTWPNNASLRCSTVDKKSLCCPVCNSTCSLVSGSRYEMPNVCFQAISPDFPISIQPSQKQSRTDKWIRTTEKDNQADQLSGRLTEDVFTPQWQDHHLSGDQATAEQSHIYG